MKALSSPDDEDLPEDVDEFFDKDKETKFLAAAKLSFLMQAFLQGVAIGNLSGGNWVLSEDVFSRNVRDAIARRNLELAAKAVQTTEDGLRSALLEAHNEGLGVRGLAQKVNDLYEESMGYRSLRIARTEITGPLNDGALQTYVEKGYAAKRWSTVMDGHERDAHGEANGQTVPIDEPFLVGGEEAMFPGDADLSPENSINCRCVVQPAESDDAPNVEKRRQQRDRIFLTAHGALERRLTLALRGEFAQQRERVLARLRRGA